MSRRKYCGELRYNIRRNDVVDYFELSGFFKLVTTYNNIRVIQNGFPPRTTWTPLLKRWANTRIFSVLLQKRG
jgi:hypothetical protein